MAWAVLAKNKRYRPPLLADVAAAYRVCGEYGFLPGLLGKGDGATVELCALETRTRKKSFKTEIVMGKRAQRFLSWPGVIYSNKGRIHLRRPTCDILTFRLRPSGGPYIPVCLRYIQKFARRCPDRFGAGLQPLDKLNYSSVDLLGSLLLGPMTAAWQQESSPKLRYKLRQVGDDLVHPTKGQNEIAVPGDVQRRDGHMRSRHRR
jgi:hypothetical protein